MKLADFGCAALLPVAAGAAGNVLKTELGSDFYVSPEIVEVSGGCRGGGGGSVWYGEGGG